MAGHTPGPWRAEGEVVVAEHNGKTWCIALAYRAAVPCGAGNARLIAAAPELLERLIQAIDESGFSLSGPTDPRVAEHGEPAWVCNARATIAKAESTPEKEVK